MIRYKWATSIVLTAMISAVSCSASAADVFKDTFESGDLSATNEFGFKWYPNVRVSVVTESREVYSNNERSSLSKTNASLFPGLDWAPYSGQHSLLFAYPAGEPWSEQRFSLGTPMEDVWIRFWLRVPVNFSYGPKGSPNKLFSLWSDGYSAKGDGSTVWLGFHRENTTDATVAITYSAGGYNTSKGYMQSAPFITTNDRGRWMHLVMHFKTESRPGASDGQIQTYRKWKGDSAYEKLHDKNGLPIKVPSDGRTNGFKKGYILGWANAHYEENTEWLLDEFVVSDSSPFDDAIGQGPKSPSGVKLVSRK